MTISNLSNHTAEIAADVCIVGSGPAAFMLASELTRNSNNLKVVIIESGRGRNNFTYIRDERSGSIGTRTGRRYKTSVQALYEGTLEGWLLSCKPDYLLESRVRTVGGTGVAWSGWWVPLTGRDLGGGTYGPMHAWPLPFEELNYWTRICASFLGIPSAPQEAGLNGSLVGSRYEIGHIILKRIDFSEKIWMLCQGSDRIDLVLNANAVEISRSQFDGSVEFVLAYSIDDKGVPGGPTRIHARDYVLCTGTIENTRLLLHNGFGKDLPVLGAYFNEHPFLWDAGRIGAIGKNGLNTLLNPNPNSITEDTYFVSSLVPHSGNAAPGFRALFGGLGSAPGTINLSWECMPVQTNTITLDESARPDIFGVAPVKITHNFQPDDDCNFRAELARLHELVCHNFDVISFYNEPSEFWDAKCTSRVVPGNHPSGTTRMSKDPKTGVVDVNCAVHGAQNLFVASASVFPTAGCANPTLSILAMAARLGNFLLRERRYL